MDFHYMSKRKLRFIKAPLPTDLRPKPALGQKPNPLRIGNFNPNFGSPLRPRPLISDDKGNPVDINLRLRQASDQAQFIKDNVKLKQQRVSAVGQTTIPALTSASSSSIPTTSSYTTSSGQGTTYYNTPGETMPRNRNKDKSADSNKNSNNNNSGNGYSNNIAYTGSEVPLASEFRKDVDYSLIGQVIGAGQPKKVDFDLLLPCTTYLDDWETSVVAASEIRMKMVLVGSSFASQLYYARTSPLTNVAFVETLRSIYRKFDSDVANTLNSYTAPSWSYDNWLEAMWKIAKALELDSYLDAEFSYDSGSMGTDSISRVGGQYRSILTGNSDIVKYRNSLRNYLKGVWFPGNFASLIRWFYQRYKLNSLQQSAVFRFVPSNGCFLTDAGDTLNGDLVTAIKDCIADLQPGTVVAKISAILNRVYKNGRITSFPKSASDNVYDFIMTEVYANTARAFNDVNSSNQESYWPTAYNTSVNDIPYYMDADPSSSLNALAYALQSIHTTDTTVGFAKDYFTGVRNLIATSLKDPDGNDVISNFQVLDNSSGKLKGYGLPVLNTCRCASSQSAHSVVFNFSGSTTKTMKVKSETPGYMQRVYFNNVKGPVLLMNELVNKLFHTKA